jgi:hypothetical protein
MADFLRRTAELGRMVGDGHLVGTFSVAGGGRTIPLEVGYWRNHMGRNGYVEIRNYHDGGPHAAQNSFEVTYDNTLKDIARTTLLQGPQEAMQRHVENVNDQFQVRAPRRTGSYRDSTGRVVMDDGMPIYQSFGGHFGQEPSV